MKTMRFVLPVFIFSLLTVCSSSAQAAVINPGFESGDFSGWSFIGEVLIAGPLAGGVPTDGSGHAYDADGNPVTPASGFSGTGNYQALLGTGIDSDDPDPVTYTNVESFLGLTPGSLAALTSADLNQGSALKQDIFANAGDVLLFDWAFNTNRTPNNPLNDYAFFAIGASPSKLADTFFGEFYKADLLNFTTGVHTTTYTFPSSGLYTFGIGVLDTRGGDTSALLVDNFRLLSSGGSVVPEPSTLILLTLGLGFSVARLKRIA